MKIPPILFFLSLAATMVAQTPIQPTSAKTLTENSAGTWRNNPLQTLFVIPDGKALTIVSPEELAGLEGAVILDFEMENGWPAAAEELQESEDVGWRAFLGTGLDPFSIEDAISSAKVGDTTITFVSAVLGTEDKKPQLLNPATNGVFIVKSEISVMPSGTQGLVAGQRRVFHDIEGNSLGEVGEGAPVGIWVQFDPPVTAVGLAHFNGDLDVAVFGDDGELLGRIRHGMKPTDSFFYGLQGDKASIHSIFVGNLYPEDGILDDLVFVP